MELPMELIQEFVGNAHGNFARVKELLEAHPDLLNSSAPWSETALQAATQMGNVPIIEYLIGKGAPVDIFTAAVLGLGDQVNAFLEADPGLARTAGVHGIPALYFPVINGHRAIAETFLARGAEVNAGANGLTPLHGAVMFAQVEMTRWLLAHNANPNLLNYENKTPLKLAVEGGKDEIAAILRDGGGIE
jgi:ankyrin repeat protein